MPYMILIPAHGLDKFISYLGVCHYITKTHLGGQDTLQPPSTTTRLIATTLARVKGKVQLAHTAWKILAQYR
jgi:hypothetical protein